MHYTFLINFVTFCKYKLIRTLRVLDVRAEGIQCNGVHDVQSGLSASISA